MTGRFELGWSGLGLQIAQKPQHPSHSLDKLTPQKPTPWINTFMSQKGDRTFWTWMVRTRITNHTKPQHPSHTLDKLTPQKPTPWINTIMSQKGDWTFWTWMVRTRITNRTKTTTSITLTRQTNATETHSLNHYIHVPERWPDVLDLDGPD